jgi:hypothetical protein
MGRTACTEPQYLYKGALYLTALRKKNNHGIESGKVLFLVEVTGQKLSVCNFG